MEKQPLDLLEELECPICTDYLTLPIRQCATGHSICGKCVEVLDQCALCKSEFTDSRNFTLEALAVKMMYPCSNEHAGCTKILEYSEREKHEVTCTFKNFQIACQMKGCSFVGDPATLKNHWKEKKNSSRMYGAINKCNLKIKNGSYYVNLVESYGQLFWFKSKIANGLLHFAVQLIGKHEEAHMFFYQIEISHQSLPKKKIIVSDYCKSISLNDVDLFKEEICVILNIGNLKFFISNTETAPNLNYTLKVFKVDRKPRRRRIQQIPGKQRTQRSTPDVSTFQIDSAVRYDNTSSATRHASTEELHSQEYHRSPCCSFCADSCVIS